MGESKVVDFRSYMYPPLYDSTYTTPGCIEVSRWMIDVEHETFLMWWQGLNWLPNRRVLSFIWNLYAIVSVNVAAIASVMIPLRLLPSLSLSPLPPPSSSSSSTPSLSLSLLTSSNTRPSMATMLIDGGYRIICTYYVTYSCAEIRQSLFKSYD